MTAGTGAVQLVCFPYAGGGSRTFHAWPAQLPRGLEVVAPELPGRGSRLREAATLTFDRLVEDLVTDLAAVWQCPYALFGHSLGALTAFEVARAVRRRCGSEPVHLFVSSCRPPHRLGPAPQLHLLPEPLFRQQAGSYFHLSAAAVANRELMDLVLPVLRADLTLRASYRFRPEAPLRCPFTVFVAQHDPTQAPSLLARWREMSEGRCTVRRVPGGHHFLDTEPTPLFEGFVQELLGIPFVPATSAGSGYRAGYRV